MLSNNVHTCQAWIISCFAKLSWKMLHFLQLLPPVNEDNFHVRTPKLRHSKLAKLYVIIPLSLTSLHGFVLHGRSNIQWKKRVGQKWNFGSAIWRQSWNVKQILFSLDIPPLSASTTSRLPSLLSNTICWKKRKSCLTGTLTTFFLEFWMPVLLLHLIARALVDWH